MTAEDKKRLLDLDNVSIVFWRTACRFEPFHAYR